MTEESRVIFEEEDDFIPLNPRGMPSSKLAQWVIDSTGGLVKTEQQANYLLLGFVIVAIIFSAFLFIKQNNSTVRSPGAETFLNTPPGAMPPNIPQP